MNEVDFTNKAICIFGLRGAGKSTWVRWFAYKFRHRAALYDTVKEIPEIAPIHAYQPINTHSVVELERFTEYVIASKQYLFYGIEEANRFCPSKPSPLPDKIALLNDLFRHKEYGYDGKLTLAFISRRPVSLNQDLTELSEFIVIYRCAGKNDRQYLNDLSAGLGDMAVRLEDYQYLLVFPDRTYQLMKPVEYNESRED